MSAITPFEELLQQVTRAAHDLWIKGWAERNAGNISVRLKQEQMPENGTATQDDWHELGFEAPALAGEFFLFSSTGCHMRNVELLPERYLGIIELDEQARRFRRVWGFSGGGRPTSELAPHLIAHAARVVASAGADRVVMHAHAPVLIALTYSMDLDTARLTHLLWEMHTECVVVLPTGCGFVPWSVPGSIDLARATAEELSKRPLAIWQFHGAIGTGPDIDTAFGLIDTAEKAAQIYKHAAACGGIRNKLSNAQIAALARAFSVTPDPEILGE
jgi:rhamnulose-1-phosphate aldolase